MQGPEYNFLSRLLHRFALQSKFIPEASFDIENTLLGKKTTACTANPVFVTGLARCGTTMLMRNLYETGLFRSLTYQDMPFVLMPNIWKKLSSKNYSGELHERAHKDGIMVSFDSPEAFEEVFWRVFCGDDYINKDYLSTHSVDDENLKKFCTYINNVILSADEPEQTRYLSKNNNNILRLPYLYKCFPKATIIIPFRDPIQHALSLLNQHQQFCLIQEENKFSLEYMNWLGHYEFGLNQKPFCFGNPKHSNEYSKNDLNFWLLSWKNYYTYVLEQETLNTFLFSYEQFCNTPSQVIGKLFLMLDLSISVPEKVRFIPTNKPTSVFDKELLTECNALFEKLENRFKSWYIASTD